MISLDRVNCDSIVVGDFGLIGETGGDSVSGVLALEAIGAVACDSASGAGGCSTSGVRALGVTGDAS